jgi:hypothetical protein
MKRMLFVMVLLMVSSIMFAQTYSGGEGTSDEPYEIATKADLKYLSENSGEWEKHFKQMADIIFSDSDFESGGDFYNDGAGFSPIGYLGGTDKPFKGSYDGDGHKISKLKINRPSLNYIGLFGAAQSANISNIALADLNINGGYYVGGVVGRALSSDISNIALADLNINGNLYVGGLIGSARASKISKCYSKGTVSGNESIGGLVGDLSPQCILEKSYSTCDVSGQIYVGGFLGVIDSDTISNCYSTGTVTRTQGSSEILGAFTGFIMLSSVQYSYSTGSVYYTGTSDPTDKGFIGGFTGSYTLFPNFFDSTASNQTIDIGATAKTTDEMKTLATFTDVSWDIVGSYNTGHTWNMESGVNSGYPYLSWAKTDDVSLPVTLASFTGKATKAGVLLEWETSAEIENAGFVIRRTEAGDRNQEEENSPQPSRSLGTGSLRGGVESEVDHSTNSPSLEGAGGVLLASYLTDNALVGQGSVTKSTCYTFTDSKVEPGKSYVYTLSDVDFSGKESILDEIKIKMESENAFIAEGYTLGPVYPNPFNASFTVPFSLNEAMNVKIALYNIAGQQVMTILNNEFSAGDYHFAVNADELSSGVYFVKTSLRLRSGTDFGHTQKIVLMK